MPQDFGLKSLADMPKPKDFKEPDNEIGEQAPIDETTATTPIAELLPPDVPPTANEETVVEATEEPMPNEAAIPTDTTDTTTLSEDAADYDDLATTDEDIE